MSQATTISSPPQAVLKSLRGADTSGRGPTTFSQFGTLEDLLTPDYMISADVGANLMPSHVTPFNDLPFSELVLPNHFYRCPLCSLQFCDKRNFRHHYMTHSGEKPYACRWCPYQARQKGTLKNHVLRRHSQLMGNGNVSV